MNTIKSYLLPYYKRYKYLYYFKKYNKDVVIKNKLWCLFNGFFPRNYILYNLMENNAEEYISDYQENFKMAGINKKAGIINNKLFFIELIRPFVFVPPVRGLFEQGRFVQYGLDSLTSVESLIDFIRSSPGVVMKPIEGDGGEGIIKVYCSNEYFIWNNESLMLLELNKRLSVLDHYFISDIVTQHAYSSSLYNDSVNTVRILTMIDAVDGNPFIAAAAHRIGNSRSKPVDNCAKGGLTANINIETGALGSAVRTYFSGEKPTWYTHHPDTNCKIEGLIIPNWSRIKETILQLALNFSFNPYIAWDIVVLPNGKITILEANDGADLKLHQVHQPLLANERVKNFYKHYKVIP